MEHDQGPNALSSRRDFLLDVFSEPVHLDLSLQATKLTSRRVEKVNPGDPVGSYTFDGLVCTSMRRWTSDSEYPGDSASSA